MTDVLASLPWWTPWILLLVMWAVIIGLIAGSPARRARFVVGIRRRFG
jgi:hypothetical protein